MSDSENVDVKKRNRPLVGEKRAHVPIPAKKDEKNSLQDGETPAKRGRGRPKGSTKKNGGNKKATKKSSNASGKGGKGRGRPTKKKDDSSDDEVDENDENDETEENDDDENDSGSDD